MISLLNLAWNFSPYYTTIIHLLWKLNSDYARIIHILRNFNFYYARMAHSLQNFSSIRARIMHIFIQFTFVDSIINCFRSNFVRILNLIINGGNKGIDSLLQHDRLLDRGFAAIPNTIIDTANRIELEQQRHQGLVHLQPLFVVLLDKLHRFSLLKLLLHQVELTLNRQNLLDVLPDPKPSESLLDLERGVGFQLLRADELDRNRNHLLRLR
uniref:Uncharacterized protein n=1 Tax=Opuntia streptacantha TaxID=393608 RepID=A0A7C9ABZ6_OPUST